MNGYIVYDTSKKTLSSATPRFVYLYFLTVYKLCCFTGLAGYLSILFQFFFCFILSLFQTTRILFEGSVRLLFYAVYYGCLVQDFAELCAEKMSSSIYHTVNDLPLISFPTNSNNCCICGRTFSENYVDEAVTLTCNHRAHEYCVRGWCIVGKKSTCPCCKEKVDLRKLSNSPWTQQDVCFSLIFDWIRYLIAWQPLVVVLSKAVIRALNLK
jgi:RING finger protein 121